MSVAEMQAGCQKFKEVGVCSLIITTKKTSVEVISTNLSGAIILMG